MVDTASKLYDNLLSIYKIQYHKLSENLKKRVDVLNIPEILILDFNRDNLPPMIPLEDD